jgi:exopolysaccharide biosynthesis protein
LDPVSEGFSERSLNVKALRTAVGITTDKNLILVVTRREITLGALAAILQQLGAVDAVNFDGGASTALYYKGRVLNEPISRLSNVLLVYEN